MVQNLNIQELAIVITAKNINSTVLNLDFFKYTGITEKFLTSATPLTNISLLPEMAISS